MTIKENLIAAKALIPDEAHWLQGSYSNHRGCFCALGAVRQVVFGLVEEPPGETGWDQTPEALALKAALPGDWRTVSFYNDYGAYTVADIHALFDHAIGAQP